MSFGEVRSILQRAPSAHSWRRLCEMLDTFGVHELDDMVFPYVVGATRQWPLELCVAPQSWVLRALKGEDVPFWSIVRALDISSAYLSDSQLLTLLSSDRLAEVRVLDLDSNRIGLKGARHLANARSLKMLEVLRLGYNRVTDAGMSALMNAPFMTGLRVLKLEVNELSNATVQTLVERPCVATLTHLDLRQNQLNSASVSLLANAPFKALTHLKLDRCAIGGSLHALHESAGLTALTSLELTACALSDQDMQHIAQCAWLSHVNVLDLSRNVDLTRKGLMALAESPYTDALKVLYLNHTGLRIEHLDVLRDLPSLTKYGYGNHIIRVGGPFDRLNPA